jgi:hypothetical protein
MRENIELVLADRGENLCSDIQRIEPGLCEFSRSGGKDTRWARGVQLRAWAVAYVPIARTIADAGANIAGTDHSDADSEGLTCIASPSDMLTTANLLVE